MRKTFIRPEIEVTVMTNTAILAGSPDGGHTGSGGFDDLDPDANAAKGWCISDNDSFEDDIVFYDDNFENKFLSQW